ncbi:MULTISPECIES: alpha/beta hydrolase [Streptomyces]|uniref:Carboxylesterase NlhH n=1 Tax=Streptomyces chartreusis NRRL 3882 TaxID=1079985 RepID=A0A2N9B3C6_STRCX|nr:MULTISPECIES: alpha/beta hydrolase [Streptomyces]SOR77827.1 Carboxylesterase NlhH [Streptomyces chartreusis NRRL 3882]
MSAPTTRRNSVETGPPPPFDPELAAELPSLTASVPSSITSDMIPELRRRSPRGPTDEELCRHGAFTVEERSAPGPPGAPPVPLLVCRPTRAAAATAAVYYIHGGGMFFGDNRSGLADIMDWAGELALSVVSVEYRLAPETPHPGPVEDCYAGLLWTVARADDLGIDPDRLVLAGRSAGGGLAAAVALLARDRGGPRPAGQLLVSPMLDDRNDSVSGWQMSGRGVWDRASNETGWAALLGPARGGPDVPYSAAPARATVLSDLPAAYLDVGSAETFRDESIAYADRLWRAGGQAELHVWPGAFHNFDALVPRARISREARRARLGWLRRLLGAQGRA